MNKFGNPWVKSFSADENMASISWVSRIDLNWNTFNSVQTFCQFKDTSFNLLSLVGKLSMHEENER